jgi:hypothetical protein
MIVEEREEDKYEYSTTIKCWECDTGKGYEIGGATGDPKVRRSPSICYHPLIILLDQISCRWSHAIHVLSPSIGSESMGRGDHPMRTYAYSGTVLHRSHSCIRYAENNKFYWKINVAQVLLIVPVVI